MTPYAHNFGPGDALYACTGCGALRIHTDPSADCTAALRAALARVDELEAEVAGLTRERDDVLSDYECAVGNWSIVITERDEALALLDAERAASAAREHAAFVRGVEAMKMAALDALRFGVHAVAFDMVRAIDAIDPLTLPGAKP